MGEVDIAREVEPCPHGMDWLIERRPQAQSRSPIGLRKPHRV